MNNTLVAYFSASGTTKNAATKLANKVNGDLFEIEPVQIYTNQDLNWNDKQSRSSVEMNDENCRPEVASKVNNLDQYETVYVGFPIWWYVEPRIIDTFLDENDLTGKNVVLFATSGGSSIKRSVQHIKSLYPQLNIIDDMML